MSNISPQQSSAHFNTIFAQLNQQDVEAFYTAYQNWNLQHQIEMLHSRLNVVRRQIIENTEHMQEVQPTAIELAILARLQSKGVSDVELLDRMLERGELWLDRTMQRLDYLEQLDDFISDDYAQWCRHALEGAYDWIDSVLDGSITSQPKTATTPATTEDVKKEELIEATEELFLQKISTDEEALTQEITMKRPSITAAVLEEVVQPLEDTQAEDADATTPESFIASMEGVNPIDTTEDTKEMYAGVKVPVTLKNALPIAGVVHQVDIAEDTKSAHNEDNTRLESAASEEHLLVESDATSTNEQPPLQERGELEPVTSKSSSSQANSTFEHALHKGPGFIKRFFGKVWGS